MSRKTPHRTHAQELVELKTGRSVREVLEELYIQRELSQGAIAEELGVSRMTVALWLRQYAIVRAVEAV
jgi:transposase